MMKMKKTNKNPFLKAILTLAIAAIVIFGFSNVADAAYDQYYGGGLEDYSYDYYQPEYDYEYDYYQPEYDYEYDYYQPEYDYEYDYYQPEYDYEEYDYQPYSYSSPSYTPSYSTPQYYSTPSYYESSYIPYTPSYSSPSYPQYTPPVYIPTPSSQNQAQSNTGVNTNTNSSNSTSNAVATSNNTNNNVNNNNNVSNNVNTNNVNVIVGTPIAQAQPQQPQYPQQNYLDGNCYISPSNITLNQDVTFTANATGGTGNYSYSWYGSDGISSNARTFTGRFTTPGSKTVNVTITSGGQSITRTCNANVDQGYINNNNNLSVYCVASPTTASIGQTVIYTAYVTGGNTSYYTYSWYGTDGLSFGNAQTIQRSYTTPGSKTATVTVYGNGQSISASCYTNITGYIAPISNVTVIRQPTTPAPTAGVYLSQIPATGIDFSMKVALFILGLIIWSAFMGYTLMNRSKKKLALAGGLGNGFSGNAKSVAEKIQAFKLANMQKRGLR